MCYTFVCMKFTERCACNEVDSAEIHKGKKRTPRPRATQPKLNHFANATPKPRNFHVKTKRLKKIRAKKQILTAIRTIESTIMKMRSRQSSRFPDFRWYSCACVSCSEAPRESLAMLITLLSMLSEQKLIISSREKRLETREEKCGGVSPSIDCCSCTMVPKSRKISLSSRIPDSISRISPSRSSINASWKASSDSGTPSTCS
jgi:hypothetical protein